MKRCVTCKGTKLEKRQVPRSLRVAGKVFKKALPALVCSSCGEASFANADLQAFEVEIAKKLILSGLEKPGAVTFVRKLLGLTAAQLAGLFDVRAETISHWETRGFSGGRGDRVLLLGFVADLEEGTTTHVDLLRQFA
jgi:YgiT-type zinc finger domain-containing protein